MVLYWKSTGNRKKGLSCSITLNFLTWDLFRMKGKGMRKKQPLNSLLGLLVLVPLASSTAGNKSFKFRFIFWHNNTNNNENKKYKKQKNRPWSGSFRICRLKPGFYFDKISNHFCWTVEANGTFISNSQMALQRAVFLASENVKGCRAQFLATFIRINTG